MNSRLLIVSVTLWAAVSVEAQTPVVSPGGVVNGASFAAGQPVAPGSLVSIFGSNLASTTVLFDSVTLSASLGGVSVKINDMTAPLALVSGGQINAQVPWNVVPAGSSGQATLVVTNSGGTSVPVQVQLTSAAPGFFSSPPGNGQIIAVNGDATIAGPPGIIPGLNSHPAVIGDQRGVILYANGLGQVDFPIDDGAISSDRLRNTVGKPTVLIGGVPVQVLFSGLTPQFPGVNQVNIFIPEGTPVGDNLPIQIELNGIRSTDKVLISVSR